MASWSLQYHLSLIRSHFNFCRGNAISIDLVDGWGRILPWGRITDFWKTFMFISLLLVNQTWEGTCHGASSCPLIIAFMSMWLLLLFFSGELILIVCVFMLLTVCYIHHYRSTLRLDNLTLLSRRLTEPLKNLSKVEVLLPFYCLLNVDIFFFDLNLHYFMKWLARMKLLRKSLSSWSCTLLAWKILIRSWSFRNLRYFLHYFYISHLMYLCLQFLNWLALFMI